MGACYSTRFLVAKGGDHFYTVPSSKRAVVKCVSATNSSGTAGSVGVFIGPHQVLFESVAAGAMRLMQSLHVVLNAGEVLQLSPSQHVTAQVSGYLLDAA